MEMLRPLVATGSRFDLRASIAREAGKLHLRYSLEDPAHEVIGGPVAGEYRNLPRADFLWKRTCFEAFIARKGEKSYWELNLAPDGHAYNFYRFDGYRVPQPPTPNDDFSLERVLITPTSLDCWLAPREEPGPLEASLCGIVETAGGIQFLSSKHAGEKPDFHLRASFAIPV